MRRAALGRNWSQRTALRSSARPEGRQGLDLEAKQLVETANHVAAHTARVAREVHKQGGARVSIENPATSYLWEMQALLGEGWRRISFGACMLGDDFVTRNPRRGGLHASRHGAKGWEPQASSAATTAPDATRPRRCSPPRAPHGTLIAWC